jgi:hypothetical protein
MTQADLFTTFEYDYVWINDGHWHSDTPANRAVAEAIVAAAKLGINAWWWQTYTVTRVKCDSGHRETCEHLHIEIQFKHD